MTQATDIILNGQGYMVAPGSYKRQTDAEPETRPSTWKQVDFVGGQRRAYQLEKDRFWQGVAIGPAYDGQGVEPWPHIETYTDVTVGTVTAAQRAPSTLASANAYIAIGRFLYRAAAFTAAAPWAGFANIANVAIGNVATDITPVQDDLVVCYGTGIAMQKWDIGASTYAAWVAGEFGSVAVGYAGQLIYANPAAGSTHKIRMSTGGAIATRSLDSPVVRMALHGGAVVIATRSSLYTLKGKADATAGTWSADPEPLFTHGQWSSVNDYQFLLSFGGKLYTWLAGQVMEFNPNTGSSRQGWRNAGLEGQACYGAAVVGDILIVTILNYQAVGEAWAFDGTGWWLLTTHASNVSCWPMSVGGARGFDAVLFRDASANVNYELVRSTYRDAVQHTYPTSANYQSSLLDAGEPANAKSWQLIGCSFEVPEARGNQASVDDLVVSINYSSDGGITYTTHLSTHSTDPTDRLLRLEGQIAGGPIEANTLQIKVAWSSLSDWAPTLRAVWAGFDVLLNSTRKTRWKMTIAARDATIHRDGAVDASSGRTLASALWAMWRGNVTLTLRDIDYDATGTQYGVRILSIEETADKPSDAARWGQTSLTIQLAEV